VIKEAIEKILGLAPPYLVKMDGGREYSNQPLHAIKEPMPDALGVHTLTGVVDYLNDPGEQTLTGNFFLHVVSHQQVDLRSTLSPVWCQRMCILTAKPPESRGYSFGQWLDPESFIIALQAMFVPDETTKKLLSMVASIKDEVVKTSADDGVSQTITARAGVALVETVKVPNPVTLRPYRTFLEVEQPAISCVFRLRQGPMLSLHEADGGLWRLEAIQNIKAYLVQAMVDLGQDIRVIA
jgi:hypothetical protein